MPAESKQSVRSPLIRCDVRQRGCWEAPCPPTHGVGLCSAQHAVHSVPCSRRWSQAAPGPLRSMNAQLDLACCRCWKRTPPPSARSPTSWQLHLGFLPSTTLPSSAIVLGRAHPRHQTHQVTVCTLAVPWLGSPPRIMGLPAVASCMGYSPTTGAVAGCTLCQQRAPALATSTNYTSRTQLAEATYMHCLADFGDAGVTMFNLSYAPQQEEVPPFYQASSRCCSRPVGAAAGGGEAWVAFVGAVGVPHVRYLAHSLLDLFVFPLQAPNISMPPGSPSPSPAPSNSSPVAIVDVSVSPSASESLRRMAFLCHQH